MRITTSILHQNVLRNVLATQEKLARAQDDVSTGQRVRQLSDDPVTGAQVLRVDSTLRGIEQYRRNTTAVRARTDAEDSVLQQVTTLLTRAKELAVQEATGTSSNTSRAAAGAEVTRIIEQVIQLGNTSVGGEFLFGGHQTQTPPFDGTGAYLGDAGTRQAEIGQGYLVTTNHTGADLLVNSGVIASLQALQTELATGTPASVGTTQAGLDSAFTNVQTLLATTGARSRQLDTALQSLDAETDSLAAERSALQDVDFEEATIRLVGLQTTLQAALGAANRILNTSITEYLR